MMPENPPGKNKTLRHHSMLRHRQEGNTLVIWFERPWWFWAAFSLPGRHRLTLQIPVSTNIEIDNSSGKVDVKNIDAQDVDLKTSSGSIIAEDIKADQSYSASSGSITLSKAFSSREISLNANSGDIKVEESAAALKVKTSSGKITIRDTEGKKTLEASSGNISVDSSGGNIESHSNSGRHTYRDISGNIRAGASSGDIIIEGSEGSLELSATSGSIKGQDIDITADSSFKTSSGSISIDYTNRFEDFTFNLSASSGTLKAGSVTARKQLLAGNGSIKITGISSSGSQSYE